MWAKTCPHWSRRGDLCLARNTPENRVSERNDKALKSVLRTNGEESSIEASISQIEVDSPWSTEFLAAHHGIVKVTSKPGKGSAFQIYFPAVIDAATPTIGTRPPPGVDSTSYSSKTRAFWFLSVTMMLEQSGYPITGINPTARPR